MNVLKRNGKEVAYDGTKIKNAIRKANTSIKIEDKRLTDSEIDVIEERICHTIKNMKYTPNVEMIQNMVIKEIYAMGRDAVGLSYAEYRYKHEQMRKNNPLYENCVSLLDAKNEEANQENANKKPILLSTQRDYMAGFVCKELNDRYYVNDPEINDYHKSGRGHNHDSDYTAQRMTNCGLPNLKDCLENGTVISGRRIIKPKSFQVAANISSQIIGMVASFQYGGQTFNLADLLPFVETSRRKTRAKIIKEQEYLHGIITTDKKNAQTGLHPILDSINETVRKAHEYHEDEWDIPAEEFYPCHQEILKIVSKEHIETMIEAELQKEIASGIQTIQYQLVTYMTTNGQSPFVSMYINIEDAKTDAEKKDYCMMIREVLIQRIIGIPDANGVFVPTAFPKILYVIDENNKPGTAFDECDPDKTPFWELTYMAAICSSKVMTPDYISAKKMREYKNGDVYGCMGCRSFLTVDRFSEKYGNIANALDYIPGEHKYWGRFNIGVSTINLPHVALSSNGDFDKFWQIFDERLELNHRYLQKRIERLKGTPSDVAPILWQHGVYARLKPGETIDRLLYHGYATASLGYAGLYECVKYMTGHSHLEDGPGKDFGIKVMQHLNDKCEEWKKAEDVDYSVYGTPIENTTYKFAKANQRDFGIIPGITDKNYVTNSYHQHVTEKTDGFTKLKKEAQFQKLSPGGAISYIELPDMQDNIPAIMAYIQYIYNTIMYAEFNIKRDYCHVCGYDGMIEIHQDENKRFYWKCPQCGNTDINKMNVFRRICGYPGENQCNQGRMNEFADRVLHVDVRMKPYPQK